jgi:hypothetical protein
MAQMGEHLPSVYKVLSSNANPPEEGGKKRKEGPLGKRKREGRTRERSEG